MTPEQLMDEILYRSDPDWQRVVDALKAAHLAGFHEGRDAAALVVEQCNSGAFRIDCQGKLATRIRALEPKP